MFKNYFKIAWRSFVKDKVYASINLIGLAVALASVLMIAAFVKYELSFDKYYSNSDRIYRVAAEEKKDDFYEKTFMTPDALAYTLKTEFPEIEAVSKMYNSQLDFEINNKILTIKYLNVDTSFFQIFNLPFISGNAKSVFTNKRSIVLTQSTAHKLFPGENAIGKKLNYQTNTNDPRYFTVTGIIKDIPPNSHFSAEAIIASTQVQETLDWTTSSSGGKYVMLKKGANINALANKIPSLYSKYNFQDNTKVIFQPVTSIHLHSHIKHEPFQTSDIKYVYIFSFIALLILFIACINYINLTTARSLQRVKEVGMRKVMGAGKRQLAFQFIAESVLFFLIALPLAFVIGWIFWPLFSGILDINAGRSVLINWKFTGVIFILSLVAGSLSGAYPAFFLSRLKPISILKDWQKSFVVNLNIRKTLIVFQFVISIGLIIATVVIYQQLSLLNNMQLGFNKDYLITLPSHDLDGKAGSFKNELKSSKDIVDVSVSNWEFGKNYGAGSSMSQPLDTLKDWNFGILEADTNFIKTMQIKLVAGRNFSSVDFSALAKMDSSRKNFVKKNGQDAFMNIIASKPIIITSTSAKNLGLKEPVVGQVIKLDALQGTVIGEINDFLGISLLEKNPMVIMQLSRSNSYGYTYVRINSKNIPQTIDFIKGKWNQFFPGKNFDFSFLDDQVADLYKEQQRLSTLFTTFATLAIIISLLGLFSLVALIAQQRTKEIGIRKVLGASVFEIVTLLSGNFIKLISLAFVITVPLVWWAINSWLQDFQYRISISWWIFIIAGLGSLCFALGVVAIQAMKAAMANPVESLRSE